MASVSRRAFIAAAAGTALAARAQDKPLIDDRAVGLDLTNTRTTPKFRLGLVTYNIAAQWDLPTLLRICKSVGISPVELRTTHKHGVEPSLSKAERADVRKRFQDADVQIWGCGTTCEFESPDPKVVQKNIETCKQFIDLAADLGANGVKVRPNGLPRDVPVEKTLDQIGRALATCGTAASDKGLEIWMEVHGPGTQDPPNARRIMEAANSPNVGCTWNSNPTDVKLGSVAASFRLLRPWIKSCHINELYKDSTGAYPYRELFRLFRETGYDRVTLCEVAKTPPDPATGEEILRYYKALWMELIRPEVSPAKPVLR